MKVTDEMVSRFLCWKLPQDFDPDGYVSFDREKARESMWPTGTNLLTAEQARKMLEHVTGPDLQPYQQRVVDELKETKERAIALGKFMDTEFYRKLDEAERNRLSRQWRVMQELGLILSERIEAF